LKNLIEQPKKFLKPKLNEIDEENEIAYKPKNKNEALNLS